jgi:hypothetical protein
MIAYKRKSFQLDTGYYLSVKYLSKDRVQDVLSPVVWQRHRKMNFELQMNLSVMIQARSKKKNEKLKGGVLLLFPLIED